MPLFVFSPSFFGKAQNSSQNCTRFLTNNGELIGSFYQGSIKEKYPKNGLHKKKNICSSNGVFYIILKHLGPQKLKHFVNKADFLRKKGGKFELKRLRDIHFMSLYRVLQRNLSRSVFPYNLQTPLPALS